jgi:hypothetical protein
VPVCAVRDVSLVRRGKDRLYGAIPDFQASMILAATLNSVVGQVWGKGVHRGTVYECLRDSEVVHGAANSHHGAGATAGNRAAPDASRSGLASGGAGEREERH